MFDDSPAAVLHGDSRIHEAPRCEACGAGNPGGFRYCVECGARAEGTLSYGALVHVELAAAWFGARATTVVQTPPPRDEPRAIEAADVRLQPANDATHGGAPWIERGVQLDTDRRAMDRAWVEMIDRMASTPAELAWAALAGEDITAVWSTTPALVAETSELEAFAAEPTVVTQMPCDVEAEVDAPSQVETEVAAPPRAAMLIQLAADGYPGQGTPVWGGLVVPGASIDLGRACPGPGADDPYLDELHVRLHSHADGLRIEDPGSRGGVWLRLATPWWLRDGDRFRLGQRFLGFDAVDGLADCGRRSEHERGRVQLVDDDVRVGLALPVCATMVLGRAGTDVVIVDDPYVSVAHCRLVPEGDGVRLEDLGSSNGTWVRLRSGDVIPFGSVVAIGQSTYRALSVER